MTEPLPINKNSKEYLDFLKFLRGNSDAEVIIPQERSKSSSFLVQESKTLNYDIFNPWEGMTDCRTAGPKDPPSFKLSLAPPKNDHYIRLKEVIAKNIPSVIKISHVINEAYKLSGSSKDFDLGVYSAQLANKNIISELEKLIDKSELKDRIYFEPQSISKKNIETQIKLSQMIINIIDKNKDDPQKVISELTSLASLLNKSEQIWKATLLKNNRSLDINEQSSSQQIEDLSHLYTKKVSFLSSLIFDAAARMNSAKNEKESKEKLTLVIDSTRNRERKNIEILKNLEKDENGDSIKYIKHNAEYINRKLEIAKQTNHAIDLILESTNVNGLKSAIQSMIEDLEKGKVLLAKSTAQTKETNKDPFIQQRVIANLKSIIGKIDLKEQLLIARVNANKHYSMEPLKPFFPILQHFEKHDPEKATKIIRFAYRLMSESNIRTLGTITPITETNQEAYEMTRDSSKADYATKAAIALSIAEVFFNNGDLLNNALVRKNPTIKHKRRLEIISIEDIKGHLVGGYSGIYNMVEFENFWGQFIEARKADPLNENEGEFSFTPIHEMTSVLESEEWIGFVNGAFPNWSRETTNEFITQRNKLFAKYYDPSLSYIERYSGMKPYAFETTERDGKFYADNFLSELYKDFRYRPAVVKKNNPIHYNILVKHLDFDPVEIFTKIKAEKTN